MNKKKILERLFSKKTLTKNEAKNLILKILKGEINHTQIIAITSFYNIRFPTVDEILGFQKAMMELSTHVNLKDFNANAIDIVGTGGDGKNTFNISTLACFVVAGTGEKVIKHGSSSSSSISGSSDILKYLGYHFTNKEEKLKKQLEQTGICYLHAPIFHPLLDKVSRIRKELGTKTIFNIIGPLINPGLPKNQLLGVNNLGIGRIYYYVYQKSKKDNNYAIIHSLDGYDEITLTSDIKCYTPNGEKFYSLKELNKNNIKVNPVELKGGKTIQENVHIFTDILSGKGTNSQNEVVLTNATFALNILNKNNFETNYEKAKYSLESGKAIKILKKFISLS